MEAPGSKAFPDAVGGNGNGNGHSHASLNGHARASELVDLIVEHASRPMEEAQALPAAYYTSEALYELEVERIFKKDWLYICRTDEVAEPGDWYAAEIAGEPIMLVRGKDMKIRALSRVCPHRFMDVLRVEREEGQDHGNKESFVCPYHSWAFDTSGELTGAPLMNRSALFEREKGNLCLGNYAVEVWQGFVFVNLDQDAEPLAPRFAAMEEVLAPYRLDEWKVLDRIDWPESPVTWKLAMDNGRECYHHQGAHSESIEPLWPSHLVDADDTTDSEHFYYQRMFVDPQGAIGEEDGHYIQPVVLPPLEGLTPYQRSHSMLVGIYPTMWFSPGPDVLLVAKWWPTGPQSHKFDLALCVHPDRLDHPDIEKIKAETREWLVQIQVEDSQMVTGIQSMLKSDRARRGGPLSHLERPMWTFQKYMAKRLAGVPANL
jgi:phenylpropionate dioxygenase-like ring-hydroxylating dioxygenase large terminal subunit